MEQLNFWVKVSKHLEYYKLQLTNFKRVFIARGNGVTVEYIIKKGSACVEAFRSISHEMAKVFGDPDRPRRHREVRFKKDIQMLVEDLERNKIHYDSKVEHFVPAKPRKGSKQEPVSRIFDVQVRGADIWSNGNFNHYIKTTTYDQELRRYQLGNAARKPAQKKAGDAEEDGDGETAEDEEEEEEDLLDSGNVFDGNQNPMDASNYIDLHGGSLGGGDIHSTGELTNS